ncbi:alpha/beta hydrolase [Roseibacterium beibuensis]|uniref:alpha/beta hydrolase family protein n=1 Tax=[Roseibacterium] beibuensis TaxID=1193142 RepID=UPI00217CE1E8|nr:alpha/beta hydrolase [Roseibacterium beibuensis]MCS6624652.1 alpha/beta hydrolase [Roseibacterium beibuensis]
MIRFPVLRRLALSLVAALVLAPAAPALAWPQAVPASAAPASAPAHIELSAPDGRAIDVSVWRAADERGVVVFSHGYNGSPAAYGRILSEWVDAGFTVVAPLHVDSLRHPRHAEFDGPAAFTTRIVDLAVVRGFVKAEHAGKPIVAAGHSFGSLMSTIAGGARTVAGPQGDPAVRAVVALSSAGDLQGVILPDSYAGLTVPTLMITGDDDLVPQYVTDWRAHRSAFDRSPAGGKMLLVFEGGDHSLIRNADEADFDLIARASTAFMEAHALGDPEALATLEALAAPDGVTIERR